MENRTIYALIDYKGYFESKINAVPKDSGMDKDLLKKHFSDQGFEIVFMHFPEVINYPSTFWNNKMVLLCRPKIKVIIIKALLKT